MNLHLSQLEDWCRISLQRMADLDPRGQAEAATQFQATCHQLVAGAEVLCQRASVWRGLPHWNPEQVEARLARYLDIANNPFPHIMQTSAPPPSETGE